MLHKASIQAYVENNFTKTIAVWYEIQPSNIPMNIRKYFKYNIIHVEQKNEIVIRTVV